MIATIWKIRFWFGLLSGLLIWQMPPFGGLSGSAQATLAMAVVIVVWQTQPRRCYSALRTGFWLNIASAFVITAIVMVMV